VGVPLATETPSSFSSYAVLVGKLVASVLTSMRCQAFVLNAELALPTTTRVEPL
jgi:hypothetical protein